MILFSIVAAVFSLLLSTAVQWYRLSHVPGPFVASLTSLWTYRAVKGLKFHRIVKDLGQKYGEIVRITPNDVMISDPETLWRLTSARSTYTRGGWYGSVRFNPHGDSVFSEMDTARHDKRKTKLMFGFSGKGLLDIEGCVDTHLATLVDILKANINEGKGQTVVDIGVLLQYFQLDLITSAGMGKAWGSLTSNKDQFDYLRTMEALFPFVHSTAMVFGASQTTGWLGVLGDAVKQRMKNGKGEALDGDMLDEWLKHDLSSEEAELDLSVQVPAGTETSITTIRGILLFLMTTPTVYNKLKKEIADGIRSGRISSPVTNNEAKELPYLQAVLSEGMRVTPAVVAGFPKKVPPGGDTVCGKFLPAGTEVHADFMTMMRNQEEFGEDVDIFRPERFLECDEATAARRRKIVDLQFGHGRWLCLGRVLALLELNKAIVELLRSFDFQIADPESPWERTSSSTFYIHGFRARLTSDKIG